MARYPGYRDPYAEIARLFGRLSQTCGQARNRTVKAVERTLPLGMVAYSLVIIWYACHAHHAVDVVAEHRRRAPWYRTKGQPCSAA
ncbi:hypothetical protein ACWDLG_44780 [Nonomuraea sp. NPDC003727]